MDAARRFQPDLILLDLMLPSMDGFEVCRIIRKEMIVPILMLTARTSEIDRVLGLELGADDYLTKPFSMRELIARVKAILRRVELERKTILNTHEPPADGELISNNLVINETRSQVYLGDEVVKLKPKEYELLVFLLKNKGKVFSRKMLLDRVWGWAYAGSHRTIDVHVRWLREKIEKDPSRPSRLLTVRGKGYRFDG